MSIVATIKPKTDRNVNEVVRYLNRIISKLDWGRKWKGKIIHINRNEDILALAKHELRTYNGKYKAYLPTITRKQYALHWANQDTLYFTGGEGQQLLACVDIDCHEKGTLADATACAEFLKANLFPGLYYEPSTNGKGVHAYFLVDRGAMAENDDVCEFLNKLQVQVQGYQHLFGISGVEIKGHPHRQLLDEKYRVCGIKAGQLCKVPRQIVERFGEFKATTVINVDKWKFDATIDAEKKAPEKNVGSWDPKLIKDWRLYEEMARKLLGGKESVMANDAGLKVILEDVCIGIAILHYCSKNMTPPKGSRWADSHIPGTLPTARVEGFWASMVRDGDTDRVFHASRWRCIRNLMSQFSAIDWTDNSYRKGESMKWRLSDAVCDALDHLVERQRAAVPVASPAEQNSGGDHDNKYMEDIWLKVLDWVPEGAYPVPEHDPRLAIRPEVTVWDLEEQLEQQLEQMLMAA